MSSEHDSSLAGKILALADNVRALEQQHQEDRREIAELKNVNRQLARYTKWMGENGKDQDQARAENTRKLHLVRELLRDLLSEVLKSSPPLPGRASSVSSVSLDEDMLRRVHSALDDLSEDAPLKDAVSPIPPPPLNTSPGPQRKARTKPPTPVATGSGLRHSARGSDQTPPSPPPSAITRSPRKTDQHKSSATYSLPASPIIHWKIGVRRKAPMSCDVVVECGNSWELLQYLSRAGKLSNDVAGTIEGFDYPDPSMQISISNGLAFVVNPAVFCDAVHLKPDISYIVDWVDSKSHDVITKYIFNPKLPAQPWHTFLARYPPDGREESKRLEWFYVGACDWGMDRFMPRIWPVMPEKRKADLLKKLSKRIEQRDDLQDYLKAIEEDTISQLSIRLSGLDTHREISREFVKELGGEAVVA